MRVGYLSLLVLLLACRLPGLGERVIKGPDKILAPGIEHEQDAILPAGAFQEEFPTEAKEWNPAWEDVMRTQLLVRDHVREHLPAAHGRWNDYRRQYGGYAGALGPVLYVNFFCLPEEGWRERPVLRESSGDCYFSLKVNMARNEAFDLSLHAPNSDDDP